MMSGEKRLPEYEGEFMMASYDADPVTGKDMNVTSPYRMHLLSLANQIVA